MSFGIGHRNLGKTGEEPKYDEPVRSDGDEQPGIMGNVGQSRSVEGHPVDSEVSVMGNTTSPDSANKVSSLKPIDSSSPQMPSASQNEPTIDLNLLINDSNGEYIKSLTNQQNLEKIKDVNQFIENGILSLEKTIKELPNYLSMNPDVYSAMVVRCKQQQLALLKVIRNISDSKYNSTSKPDFPVLARRVGNISIPFSYSDEHKLSSEDAFGLVTDDRLRNGRLQISESVKAATRMCGYEVPGNKGDVLKLRRTELYYPKDVETRLSTNNMLVLEKYRPIDRVRPLMIPVGITDRGLGREDHMELVVIYNEKAYLIDPKGETPSSVSCHLKGEFTSIYLGWQSFLDITNCGRYVAVLASQIDASFPKGGFEMSNDFEEWIQKLQLPDTHAISNISKYCERFLGDNPKTPEKGVNEVTFSQIAGILSQFIEETILEF